MSLSAPLREGEVFEGPVRVLADTHFELFSEVTADRHPIHHDAEYARATRFGKPVAHGLLLASLTALGASTGRDRCHGFAFIEQGCRFLAPVFVGDTVRPSLAVERVWREGHRQFCRFKTSILNQRGEQVLDGFHVYRVFAPEEFKASPKMSAK
jgi:3-hydroxybutyryl-CoA dehydratase